MMWMGVIAIRWVRLDTNSTTTEDAAGDNNQAVDIANGKSGTL